MKHCGSRADGPPAENLLHGREEGPDDAILKCLDLGSYLSELVCDTITELMMSADGIFLELSDSVRDSADVLHKLTMFFSEPDNELLQIVDSSGLRVDCLLEIAVRSHANGQIALHGHHRLLDGRQSYLGAILIVLESLNRCVCRSLSFVACRTVHGFVHLSQS